MEMKKLRLRARGAAMYPHHGNSTQHGSARRFVGRVFDPNMGDAGGWPPSAEADEVLADSESLADYRRAVQDGDLWVADEATASLCGVKFDPKYGGELAEMKDQLAAAKPKAAPAAA
jgi:hypothetical protein